MSVTSPFLVLNCDCENATRWMVNQLTSTNLTVLRTFNSKDVRTTNADCLCPHHGTSQCNCQIMIYLVYKKGQSSPTSLMIHGYDQYTLFYLVDNPQQRIDPSLEAAIHNALIPDPAHLFIHVHEMAK
jgi:hypothetical protein